MIELSDRLRGAPLRSQTDALLEVRHLSVEFRTSGGNVHAAQDVSLTIHEGQTVGLVGESGSGKTATALAILRLLPASARVAGSIRLAGRDLLRLNRRQLNRIRGADVAVVFQDPMSTLNPVLTIGHQIGEALRIHRGFGRRATLREAIALLEMVEIPDARRRVNDYPHQFSGGMRQRAMIAMALSCRPKLLVADEPTTALDVTVQAQILDLLDRLKGELGMAMLLITHDFGVVAGSAEAINVMYAGRIVETGAVREVFDRPRHPYTDGLLKAIPELGIPKSVRLAAIPGQPPSHAPTSGGCSFAPRCPHAFDPCSGRMPPLFAVSPTRACACWLEQSAGSTDDAE